MARFQRSLAKHDGIRRVLELLGYLIDIDSHSAGAEHWFRVVVADVNDQFKTQSNLQSFRIRDSNLAGFGVDLKGVVVVTAVDRIRQCSN